MAASTGASIAVAFAVVASMLVLPVINALKGKWWFALLFFVPWGPVLGLVGAIRLAKPHSYWARRWYTEDKRTTSMVRFAGRGGRFPGSEPSQAEMDAAAALRDAVAPGDTPA